MEEGSNGLGEVTASVILDSDLTWTAYVGDKKVPDTCNVLARFQSSPLTDDKLSDMIKAIDNPVYAQAIQIRNLSQHSRIKEDV